MKTPMTKTTNQIMRKTGTEIILYILIILPFISTISIDYVELSVPYSNYNLQPNYPYRFIKGFGEDSLLLMDNECRKFSVEEKDIKTYYTITGSKDLKNDCHYNETSIKRILRKDKLKFGFIQVLLIKPSQQMLDVKNNIVLEPTKQYIVISIDATQNIYRVFGENCENYTIDDSAISEMKIENVSTSLNKNCNNKPHIGAYLTSIRNNDIALKNLWALSETPMAETIDPNDDRKIRGINDLIDLANQLKSSISQLMLATSVTKTETITKTITSSKTSTEIRPTTVTETLPPNQPELVEGGESSVRAGACG